MFGMGMPEIILILAIALIVFGPKKLPELAKSLGRAINEFKRATTEFKDTIEDNTGVKEFKQATTELKDAIDITPESLTSSPKAETAEKNEQTLKQKPSSGAAEKDE